MASLSARTNPRTGVTVHRVTFRPRLPGHPAQRVLTFATEHQARAWITLLDAVGPARALAALEQDPSPSPAAARTVAEQVAHHIDHLTGVEAGTISDYRAYLRRDLTTGIGALPLATLRRDDVAAWVNHLERDRGLSTKSIKNRHALLSAALRSAVRDELVPTNVAEGIRLPARAHDADEMVTLTVDEVHAFVAATAPAYQPLVLALFGIGFRFGEATALQVADVQVEAGQARVRRAWKHTDGNGHRLGPPKSGRPRTVVFGRAVAEALKPLVVDRPPDAFMFTNARGGPVRRSGFADIWASAVHRFAGDTPATAIGPRGGRARVTWEAGPGKRPTPHDARHTYASLQIARGASDALLQRQLGHSSITTTIDTYTHLHTDDLHVLSDIVDAPLDLAAPLASPPLD